MSKAEERYQWRKQDIDQWFQRKLHELYMERDRLLLDARALAAIEFFEEQKALKAPKLIKTKWGVLFA